MSLQTTITQVILEVGITTISELAKNIVYFILIYLGFKLLAKEIRNGAKNIPTWLEEWDKIKMKHYQIEKAIEGRNKYVNIKDENKK